MREVHESIDDFRREMKTMGVGSGDEGDSGSETDKQQTEQSNVAVHRVGGRMVFNPVHSVRPLIYTCSMNLPLSQRKSYAGTVNEPKYTYASTSTVGNLGDVHPQIFRTPLTCGRKVDYRTVVAT